MSEAVNQNSPKFGDQIPEKKKWKKSAMRKWGGLAVLISALLVFAGVPFSGVLLIDVVLLIIVEIYGRVTGKIDICCSDNDIFRETRNEESLSQSLTYGKRYFPFND